MDTRANMKIHPEVRAELNRLKKEHGGGTYNEMIRHAISEHDLAQWERCERGKTRLPSDKYIENTDGGKYDPSIKFLKREGNGKYVPRVGPGRPVGVIETKPRKPRQKKMVLEAVENR